MASKQITRKLPANHALLLKTGSKAGDYVITIDKVIQVREISSGREWSFPLDLSLAKDLLNPNPNQSAWYPGANKWENRGSYKVKYNFPDGVLTDILYARGNLSDKEADKEHIHIYRVGGTDQEAVFKDSQGRLGNLSDHDIKMILSGARPLF